MRKTIRALSKPQNLYAAFLSSKNREVLEGDWTLLYDGEQLVAEMRHFPCDGGWGELRELRLANGCHFRREAPGAQWVCVGGTRFSEKFDHIGFYLEETDPDGCYPGCASLNVVAHDFSYHEVDW